MKRNTQEIRLQGVPISRGIAIGKSVFITHTEEAVLETSVNSVEDIGNEVYRYRNALIKARIDLENLQDKLKSESVLEGAAILDAQIQMMSDPLLTLQVEQKIEKEKMNAEWAFQSVVKQCQKRFNALSDHFFRDRFKDIQDIAKRVMRHLQKGGYAKWAGIPVNSIIFSNELTPADIAEANGACILAFVTETGGATSHAAIVAKAKGIPYVTCVPFKKFDLSDNSQVVVDARTGEIIVNPTEESLEKYDKLRLLLHSHLQKLKEVGAREAETFDGYRLRLSANIEMINEVDMIHQFGGNGVGLFRSEYVFLPKGRPPSEDEQYRIYQTIVDKMRGLPLVIRTFDIGGDKCVPNSSPSAQENPFLGCRAIRFLLKEKTIFKTQLRAILRASQRGNVSIMFPMVSALSELHDAKGLLLEVRSELEEEGLIFTKPIRIGCMIEVPSAAIISDLLAKECDFLSIGTNDLVQYSLAVDRGNHEMSGLYAPTHPSVIRLIKLVVTEANQQGIPVNVCGEIAADPRFTPLLLGLGVHELSVASRHIPVIKNAIRNTSIIEASRIAEKALTLQTAAEIQNLLDEEYKQNVPDDCFFNY
jgi:phosphotransferase system enzyme I (PtsI)